MLLGIYKVKLNLFSVNFRELLVRETSRMSLFLSLWKPSCRISSSSLKWWDQAYPWEVIMYSPWDSSFAWAWLKWVYIGKWRSAQRWPLWEPVRLPRSISGSRPWRKPELSLLLSVRLELVCSSRSTGLVGVRDSSKGQARCLSWIMRKVPFEFGWERCANGHARNQLFLCLFLTFCSFLPENDVFDLSLNFFERVVHLLLLRVLNCLWLLFFDRRSSFHQLWLNYFPLLLLFTINFLKLLFRSRLPLHFLQLFDDVDQVTILSDLFKFLLQVDLFMIILFWTFPFLFTVSLDVFSLHLSPVFPSNLGVHVAILFAQHGLLAWVIFSLKGFDEFEMWYFCVPFAMVPEQRPGKVKNKPFCGPNTRTNPNYISVFELNLRKPKGRKLLLILIPASQEPTASTCLFSHCFLASFLLKDWSNFHLSIISCYILKSFSIITQLIKTMSVHPSSASPCRIAIRPASQRQAVAAFTRVNTLKKRGIGGGQLPTHRSSRTPCALSCQ